MKEWKIKNIVKIIEKPTEIDFQRLGSSLFVASPFCFCWKEEILFSYSHHRDSFYKEDEKEIIQVHFIYNIEYTKDIKYKRFIELRLDTADVRLIDRADEQSSAVYFPIEKVKGNHYDKIVDKIMEK